MSESHVKSATDRQWPHKANSATSWSFSLPAQAIQGACLAGWPAPASQAALSCSLPFPVTARHARKETTPRACSLLCIAAVFALNLIA